MGERMGADEKIGHHVLAGVQRSATVGADLVLLVATRRANQRGSSLAKVLPPGTAGGVKSFGAGWFQAHAGVVEETVQLFPVREVGSQLGIYGLSDDNCAVGNSLEKGTLGAIAVRRAGNEDVQQNVSVDGGGHPPRISLTSSSGSWLASPLR